MVNEFMSRGFVGVEKGVTWVSWALLKGWGRIALSLAWSPVWSYCSGSGHLEVVPKKLWRCLGF